MGEGTQLYWGDMHTNIHPHQVPALDHTYQEARAHLDFFPVAYYPAEYYHTPEGLAVETIGQRDGFLEDWEAVLAAVRRYNEPGRFVTFAGYEWHGDRRRYGDHNFYYFDEGPLAYHETLPDQYVHLHRAKGIAIPHHTGYLVGERGKDWSCHDEDLSPFAEIYSDHGSSEGCNTPFTMNRVGSMGPRVSGGTVEDGLARGYRLGIIASGDNHGGFPGVWGNGLAGVWAPKLTRESLWEAFMSRRVYGVTGDRIKLEFQLNGHDMGSVVPPAKAADIRATIVGEHAIDRVELLRNERVIHTHSHSGTWDVPHSDVALRLKLRLEFGWGPSDWYGLKTSDRSWRGNLSVDGGRILAVQGCFTSAGQRVERPTDRQCNWQLLTEPRTGQKSQASWAGGVGGANIQGLVIELEASGADRIHLEVEGEELDFSVGEAFAASRVLALTDQAKELINDQLGQSPAEVENPDVFYHNAHKVKIHVAIPEVGYTVPFHYVDESPPAAWNWYRLRVTQLNGQMAWSSPIWLDNRPGAAG